MDKLVVNNLSKAFRETGVLHSVSFTVKDGEFLSILGPSGCGKTTILRILIGLETADSGEILKGGENITNLPSAQRKMGIVFQNYALFENMSVLRNVEYALLKSAGTKSDFNKVSARKKATEMLDLVGLSEHLDKKPRQLSGGQQQRVAIARTLALNPDVILFDEPMSALDVDTRLSLRSELKELQKRFGTTMIYITHDQEEAFAMSDRIMVMDAGIERKTRIGFINEKVMISLKRLSPSTENGTTAIDEVKAVCKHIVASHNNGAIADLVRRVIFNQSAVE